MGAYANSGQVCISVQRIYSQREVFEPFTEKFVRASEQMVVGDPLDERVDVGPMIDLREAQRIEGWVNEASVGGAHVLTGGKREGAVYYPTVLTQVTPPWVPTGTDTFQYDSALELYMVLVSFFARSKFEQYVVDAVVVRLAIPVL